MDKNSTVFLFASIFSSNFRFFIIQLFLNEYIFVGSILAL